MMNWNRKLPSFIDVFGFYDNLSTSVVEAVANEAEKNGSKSDNLSMNVFDKYEESVNSKIIEYILNGRIPNNCNLLNFGKLIMRGQAEELENLEDMQVKEHMRIDAVVVIIPRNSDESLPKKLIRSIKQETKERDRGIHLLRFF